MGEKRYKRDKKKLKGAGKSKFSNRKAGRPEHKIQWNKVKSDRPIEFGSKH